MTMDAVLTTIVAGGRAWTRLNIFSRNKLISTLIYGIYLITSTVAQERTCSRPPTPQATWVHQIHAAGGASGSTTMVMVFVRWFVCFCVVFDSWLVSRARPTYVLEGHKVSHPGLHHTKSSSEAQMMKCYILVFWYLFLGTCLLVKFSRQKRHRTWCYVVRTQHHQPATPSPETMNREFTLFTPTDAD
jgi:hypothetical protein